MKQGMWDKYHIFMPLLKNFALQKLNMIPRFIWATPRRIDIFIFNELRNGNSLREPCHAGSKPKGYVSRVLIKPTVVASLQQNNLMHLENNCCSKANVVASRLNTCKMDHGMYMPKEQIMQMGEKKIHYRSIPYRLRKVTSSELRNAHQKSSP